MNVPASELNGRPITPMPELAPPAPVENLTMMIDTPDGYIDHPRKRKWVIAVVAAGAVALGIAVAMGLASMGIIDRGGRPDEKAAGAAGGADSAVGPLSDAKANVHIVTVPPGASVFDENGRLLTVTPADIEVERSDKPLTLVFRHPRARERTKRIVVMNDTALTVELEPVVIPGMRSVDAGPISKRARRSRPRSIRGRRWSVHANPIIKRTTRPASDSEKPPRQPQRGVIRAGDDVLAPDFD